MRIIIEIDQETRVTQTTTAQEAPASDAGGPPPQLLAEVELGSGDVDDGTPLDGGAPPAWLIQAVESDQQGEGELLTAIGDGNGTAANGGGAPEAA